MPGLARHVLRRPLPLIALKRRWSFKQQNNGRIFLSQRDAQEELGRDPHRDTISRWYRELVVSGLIGPGDRKSIAPMAERLALGAYDQLHHSVAAGVWDATPVETELLVQADRLYSGHFVAAPCDPTDPETA